MIVTTVEDKNLSEQIVCLKRYIVTKSPSFASIAVLPQYKCLDPKEFPSEIAFTDGVAVYLGKTFFKEPLRAQLFILIHELLHIALRHVQRGKEFMEARLAAGKPWSHRVWNYAVDAIVNFSLKNIEDWTLIPSLSLVTFEDLLSSSLLRERPPHTWNSEELFMHLMDEIIMPSIKSGEIKNVQDWEDGQKWKGKREFLDIWDPADKDIQKDTSAERKEWANRVERARAGDDASGVLRNVLGDLPKTETPWDVYLRKFLSQYLMPFTEVTPTKQHRHMLALRPYFRRNHPGRSIPFVPGIRNKPGIRKLVVVVDTSASIDDELLNYFCTELQTIRKKVGCDLVLIPCDAQAYDEINIPIQGNLMEIIKNSKGLQGGGGTNFRPGVEAAEKIKNAACIVYLTDMYGAFPQKCSKPLLWASITKDCAQPPIGKVIYIKHKI